MPRKLLRTRCMQGALLAGETPRSGGCGIRLHHAVGWKMNSSWCCVSDATTTVGVATAGKPGAHACHLYNTLVNLRTSAHVSMHRQLMDKLPTYIGPLTSKCLRNALSFTADLHDHQASHCSTSNKWARYGVNVSLGCRCFYHRETSCRCLSIVATCRL